jgi:hypothetical protein
MTRARWRDEASDRVSSEANVEIAARHWQSFGHHHMKEWKLDTSDRDAELKPNGTSAEQHIE